MKRATGVTVCRGGAWRAGPLHRGGTRRGRSGRRGGVGRQRRLGGARQPMGAAATAAAAAPTALAPRERAARCGGTGEANLRRGGVGGGMVAARGTMPTRDPTRGI